jgi:ubiquinone/menaquinone biosynthesis C-methylase UbiE
LKDIEINRLAEYEDNYWWHLGRQKIIMKLLEQYIKTSKIKNFSILDAGCGTGGTTLLLKDFGIVHAIDYSINALNFCKQRGLNNIVNCTTSDLPFSQECFDIITILDSLEHIRDDVGVLKQLSYVLKKDGIIIITVPAFQFLWSNHDLAVSHVKRYTLNDLTEVLAKVGLQRVRITYFMSLLFPLIAIYKVLSKYKNTEPKADLVPLPGIINKILQSVLSCECRLLTRMNLPFGSSLLCISKKG